MIHTFTRTRAMFALLLTIALTSGCSEPTEPPTEQTFKGMEYSGNVSSLYAIEPPGNSATKEVDFKWHDSTGAIHSLSDFYGKVVLLNFWATWCTNCEADLVSLAQMATAHKDVVVLAVSTDKTAHSFATVRDFTAPKQLPFQVVIDSSMSLMINYIALAGGSYTLPETFVIGKDGNIRFLLQGAQTKAGLEQYVKAAQ